MLQSAKTMDAIPGITAPKNVKDCPCLITRGTCSNLSLISRRKLKDMLSPFF